MFCISPKGGGTGLNLTAADIVIHYDPWWNVAVQNQATDRAHRIGQKHVVTVYKLVSEGTIEEKIIAIQERKKNWQNRCSRGGNGFRFALPRRKFSNFWDKKVVLTNLVDKKCGLLYSKETALLMNADSVRGVVRAERDLSTDRSDSLTWQILKNETHVYLWFYIADGDGSGAQRIYISLFYMRADGKCIIRAECVCVPCGRGQNKMWRLVWLFY